ncbi:phosphatase PAP2 family protein [Cohnella sp. REN36]|uniref:phosphatase PAP2 family protein n=1 Tax=Cohnella sp. REN36 TaxID=2887347 RepID=UPI001D135082|nr:phosphatase PAP2 family protein [Cohnella sp. REN36]MCC3376934.1 phosphatase PAP2 family protein [Cohnella sp. REN36]
MWAIHSMATISALTAVAAALLIRWVGGRGPLEAVGIWLRLLAVSPRALLFFAALLTILLANKYELRLEALFPEPKDLTAALTDWEGAWQGRLQRRLASPALTWTCALLYLVIFQAFVITSITLYASERNKRLYYAFCTALLLDYLIAMPFFLLLPVNEAWHVAPQIRFLMLDVYPEFESQYRRLSGLDNCFPSLHTAISVTTALIALRSGRRKWALLAWLHAGAILFSIFYLGIHWATDMLAGIALAAVASATGWAVGGWAARADRPEEGRSLRGKLASSRYTGS